MRSSRSVLARSWIIAGWIECLAIVAAAQGANATARQHAVWALASIGYPGAIAPLASGAELRLRKDAIEPMEVVRRSLMPDGLLNVLSREEVRDLPAFLQGLE